MRTLIDKRSLLQAAILLTIAVSVFGLAWMTWPGSSGVACTGPGVSEKAIRECVAQEAQATDFNAPTLLLVIIGAIVLGAGSIRFGRAIRRVISLADAAQELGMPPGALRQLVDDGTLHIYERKLGAVYLYPEQVHRYAVGTSVDDGAASG